MQLFLMHTLHRLYISFICMYNLSTIYDKICCEFMKCVEINQISVRTKKRLYSEFDSSFNFTGSVSGYLSLVFIGYFIVCKLSQHAEIKNLDTYMQINAL